MNVRYSILMDSASVVLNGRPVPVQGSGSAMLSALYHAVCPDYPKYFKMDVMCRVGFMASELLLASEGGRFVPREDRAVMILTREGCISNDRRYQETISSVDEYFPSPSLFVYTLPNIVTGEIAIRNRYHGETSCYVMDDCSMEAVLRLSELLFADPATGSVLCGGLDCRGDDDFDVRMYIVER